jgi:hypothetical protein
MPPASMCWQWSWAGCRPPRHGTPGGWATGQSASGSSAGRLRAGPSGDACSATPGCCQPGAGLRLAGLVFDPWTPAIDRLAHHHAAAVVRLHREPVPGQGGWVCERELWRRRGRASWHTVDGALPAPVPAGWQGISEAWELVEVELTQKARPRLVAALKTRPPHTAAITYYVPTALHAALSAQLASVVRELGGRPEVTVTPLPQVPSVA